MLDTIVQKLSAVPAKPLTVTEAQWLLSKYKYEKERADDYDKILDRFGI